MKMQLSKCLMDYEQDISDLMSIMSQNDNPLEIPESRDSL